MKNYIFLLYILNFYSLFLVCHANDENEKYFEYEDKIFISQKNIFQIVNQNLLKNVGSQKNISYETKCWMEQNSGILNKKPLCKIVLPGSHDTGSYNFNRKSNVVDLSNYLGKARKIIKWLPGDGIVSSWSKTQKLNIQQQLNAGVRYFDLRICQMENKNFYLYHGLQGPNLEPVFQTFHDFLKENKGEILILDMSHFFKVDHKVLINLIKKYLVEFCAKKKDVNALVTYEELVRANKRCIIYYSNSDISDKNDFLLGESDSFWANELDIKKLKNSLKNYHLNKTHTNLWVLQYVLTPDGKYIFKHLTKSVESMAKITHKHMNAFLQDLKKSIPLNIVMFDFVDENLCRRIIDLNF